MANYNATNSLADLVETNPTGAEDAGKVDDVLRETRQVFKSVLSLVHAPTGQLRVCVYKEKPTLTPGSGYPAPNAVNVWHTKSNMQRVLNLGTVDQSVATAVVKPVAGTYVVLGTGIGYQIGRTQIRLFNISDNLPVANCYGNVAFAVDQNTSVYQDAGSQDESFMFGFLTTDGTKTYRMEQIHQINNTVSGWGTGQFNNATWLVGENVFSQLLFLKVG